MLPRPAWETGPGSMTFLPIVGRELRVAARLPATFRNRTLTAGLVAAAAFVMLLLGSVTGSPAFIGEGSFRTLAYLALCFCLLEGLRKTADCVSEEKREGTLGLLFLTDLKGYDVVLGKLAATSLNSFYGLVAILPLLALPLLLGGVTAGEYWRVVLALLNILFFSLCAGLAASSCSTKQQQASVATVLVILLICAVPLLTFTNIFFPLSPVYGFHKAFAEYYTSGHAGFWGSFGATQLWSWLLLAWASLAAPRSWQETEVRGQWPAKPRRRWLNWKIGRNESREEMLKLNPVLWLAARGQGRTPVLNLFVVIAVIQAAVFTVAASPDYLDLFIGCAVALNFIVKILLAEQAARFFAEARRENALEMLLGTPLTHEQIINGQVAALERLFLVPVFIILLAEFIGGLAGLFFSSLISSDKEAASMLGGFVFGALIYLALFCADVAAVIWAGMYFGLTAKNPGQAATKTVLFVLVMPLATLFLWCFGWLFFIVSPIFWMTWGKSKLDTQLRELAGYRYALNPVDPYRRPAPGSDAPTATPPVINQQPQG
jgi:hypothetical protein